MTRAELLTQLAARLAAVILPHPLRVAIDGVDAAGKPAAKIPSLTGDDAKKLSDADLSKAITEKPKHAGIAKSLTPDQVKMVVSYIRDLQKK